MFRKIPFTEKEMDIIGEIPGFMPGMPGTPYRNPPVTPRENMDAIFYEKKPFWLPTSMDMMMFNSDLYSKNLSRGMGADMTDVFGIEWEWVPSAGGSIVHPGSPTMDDVNNWKEFIKIPDVTQWDWAGEAKEKKLDPRFSAQISLINGVWFERLISFMDFVPAAMALIDDDQKDAVKELFQATTDMACKIVDMLCENYPLLDFIQIHDDWGPSVPRSSPTRRLMSCLFLISSSSPTTCTPGAARPRSTPAATILTVWSASSTAASICGSPRP